MWYNMGMRKVEEVRVKGATYKATPKPVSEDDGSHIWDVTYSVHGQPVSNSWRGRIVERDGRFHRHDQSFSHIREALTAIATPGYPLM